MLQEWVRWTRKVRHLENKRREEQLLRYAQALNCAKVIKYFSFSSVYVTAFSRAGHLTEDTNLGPLFRKFYYPTTDFTTGSIISCGLENEPALLEVDWTRESGGENQSYLFKPSSVRLYCETLLRKTQRKKKKYLPSLTLLQFTAPFAIIIATIILLLFWRLFVDCLWPCGQNDQWRGFWAHHSELRPQFFSTPDGSAGEAESLLYNWLWTSDVEYHCQAWSQWILHCSTREKGRWRWDFLFFWSL